MYLRFIKGQDLQRRSRAFPLSPQISYTIIWILPLYNIVHPSTLISPLLEQRGRV